MYQLTVGNTKLKFETKTEAINAMLSKWYYDRFPYRWYTDMWGNTLITDDWIAEYNHRREKLWPRFETALAETGVITFDGLKVEQID